MTENEAATFASYPKLFALGHPSIADLFSGTVVVEEKVDGSQFSFGVFNGTLQCRSRRCVMDGLTAPDLFKGAYATAKRLEAAGLLVEGRAYRGEALQTPSHNSLKYERTPKGHFILFDCDNGAEAYSTREAKEAEAARLGLEVVPVLFEGEISDRAGLANLLKGSSILGGPIEGIVIKNYSRFGYDKKPLFGKWVTEDFKEIHQGEWKAKNPGSSDIVETLVERYRSEARWLKAVYRLRDEGRLTNSPKDIGLLVQEVQKDLVEECEPLIKQDLYNWAIGKILRGSIGRFPIWYKERLADQQPFKDTAA